MSEDKSRNNEKEIIELRAELNRLRRQNEELASEGQVSGGESSKRPGRWKNTLVVIFLVIGLILAPISVAAVWLNRQIVNTDAYVATVAPLSSNPVIQSAVATFVTDEIFKAVDANKLVKDSLPPNASFLVGPLVGNLKGFTRAAVLKAVKTPAFSKIWSDANRVAHKTITDILLGRGPVSTSSSGKVTVDLGKLLDQIKTRLNDSGITILNSVPTSSIQTKFTLFQSKTLANIKTAINFLNSVAIFLPLLVIAFIAAAIGISPNRRKTVLWTGMGLSIGMVVLAIGLVILRSQYLGAVAGTGIPSNVAAAVFDTILQTLRTFMRGVFLLGLIIAGGAVLAGPSKSAVQFRSWAKDLLDRGSAGLDFGPAGDWIGHNKMPLRVAGIIVSLFILILVQLTPLSVLLVLLALLIYLGAIEFFGHKTSRAHPATH